MKNITFRSPKITINGSTISPHIIYPGATFKTEIDCPLGLKDDDNDEVMYFKGSTKETNFSNNITLKDNFTLDNYKLYDDSPNFKLSPNPNDGKFQITVSNNTDLLGYSAEIIDFSGRKVLSNQKLSSHSQLIDLSSHPNGLYIIKIYKNNIVFWISKILKTN